MNSSLIVYDDVIVKKSLIANNLNGRVISNVGGVLMTDDK